MIETAEALSIFLLFLPGMLCQRIVELLTPRQPRGSLERLIDGAALSAVIYGLYLAVAAALKLPTLPVMYAQTVAMEAAKGRTSVLEVDWRATVTILLLSVLVGAFLGKWTANGRLYYVLGGRYVTEPRSGRTSLAARVQRRLRRLLALTTETGRATVWEDALAVERTPLIAVTLKDGRVVIGSCKYYSGDRDKRELLVIPPDFDLVADPRFRKVLLLDTAAGPARRAVEGVLVTHNAEIQTVEFLGEEKVNW